MGMSGVNKVRGLEMGISGVNKVRGLEMGMSGVNKVRGWFYMKYLLRASLILSQPLRGIVTQAR